MKAVIVSLVVFASAALAQTTTACGADYIVEACLGTENGKLSSCATTDYVCRCTAFANILTCFNNCPNDVRRFDYEGQQKIFCGYASQFPSTATTVPAATTGTVEPTKTGSAETTQAASGSGAGAEASGSKTNSADSSTKTNNAADLAMNAGGILAAVAGVVAAVL